MDTLPLIPEKGSICADVRPIIRKVFRELDHLPPLRTELPTLPASTTNRLPTVSHGDQWTEKCNSERKEIWQREGELKRQHAARLSREPLPNIYHLSAPPAASPPRDSSPHGQFHWQLDQLIARRDLVPSIKQNAGRDGSLWIKNILNRSSCDVSAVEVVGRSLRTKTARLVPCDDSDTLHSFSIGEVATYVSLPQLPTPQPPPLSDYMLCVPPQLDFVNFTIGQLHTQGLRLVNVSKYEIRLSVRPPKRRELDVEISSLRGLTVTSGAAAEFRVHFRPCDVMAVRDMMLIRVSLGRNFLVPIACYMEPPLLDILIPSVLSEALTCKPREAMACDVQHSCDVLEMGTRLLGDVHSTRMLLHCDAEHAAFFIITEDNWFSLIIDCVAVQGSVLAGSFVLWPAWWGGGGIVRGCVWCRAPHVGLHATALRVLSSTAVVRNLYLLADSVLFRPEHITVSAQEKDYDICGDGEPACEYYVHLGTAFPRRPLSATVQLINHSPVIYSYYWSVRTWGACSCWEDESSSDSMEAKKDSEHRCVTAKEARALAKQDPELYERRFENARLVRVEPGRGQVTPRSTCSLHVHVPNVGTRLGVQRAVLMLILKDIPRESFPPDYEPMIIRSEDVATEAIPGLERTVRELCDIVCAQMEVWWDVVPVQFVLDPPALSLPHSRRLESVMVDIKATQLFGSEGAHVTWQTPAHVPPPPPLCLAPANSRAATLCYPLPNLPNYFPETDVITVVAAKEEWQSQCRITRQCATRHPGLLPERTWLGVVAPGTHMHTSFQIFNETYQHICWWAEPFRWLGENEPSRVCLGRMPCDTCHERACSCGLLRPARGAFPHQARAQICYDVNAPERDGCVATLVRVRRTGADVAVVPGGPGVAARAALVFYRVLAPRLVLRLLPCQHDPEHCSGCRKDAGARGCTRGTATLRPRQALTLGRSTCYRLRLTNVTPLPTNVKFDKKHDAADVLRVKFSPSEFRVRPFGEEEVRVVLEARRVCGRRLFVYRALVERAYQPVYMLVDTAIEGVKISCEVPLGDCIKPDSFVILTRTQREEFPWEEGRPKPTTAEEMFAEEDRKKQTILENCCHCPFEILYIPPPRPRPKQPELLEEQTPIEIVSQSPSLTRVCPCDRCSKPLLPQLEQPICLQFTAVPLRTVRSRTLLLRNESVVTAHWRAAVRRFPRVPRRTLDTDPWASDVEAPGVALACSPACGLLGARAHVPVSLRVYADCWGLYHDQLLIQVEDVEPIVLDVWVEARGAPLQFAITPAREQATDTPVMWTSLSDSERVLRATNVSRVPLTVHAYTAAAYEYPQDALPFRLYLRYYDTPPRSCPCLTAFNTELADEESASSSVVEEVDTGFEIYLAPDHGPQNDSVYTVWPEVATVGAGEIAEWRVLLAKPAHAHASAPDVDLLLRLLPTEAQGAHWARGEPPAQAVRLRQAPRAPRLQLSARELYVRLCALHLPPRDMLRVRKRFQVLNVGSGVMDLGVETAPPWSVVHESAGAGGEAAGECGCDSRLASRLQSVPLRLEPQSSTEMCVEVRVTAAREWPRDGAEGEEGAAYCEPPLCQPPIYPPRTVATTPLYIYDADNILATLPLRLELEFPVVRAAPAQLDLRVVPDGDTRKCYFSVSHSSRTETLDLTTEWIGSKEFKIWPPFLRIGPGESANVYLQYTAVYQAAPVEGCACVYVCAAAWCRAVVYVRATPARDHKFHRTRHDHTDDPHLLPALG